VSEITAREGSAVPGECVFVRSFILSVAVLLSLPAWATGERVVITQGAEALRETVCVSMTCVPSGSRDAVVSARPVKRGMEFTVRTAGGAVRLVHVAPLHDGVLSSVDVVRVTALVLRAIEAPGR
jgi:hypothetical protein